MNAKPSDSGASVCFSTPWFQIEELPAEDGLPFYRFTMPNAVVVLPIDIDGNFVLIKQFREVVGRHTLEFPAGDVDEGESAHETARRELLEETGYRCRELVKLGNGTLRLNRDKGLVSFFIADAAYPDMDFHCSEQIETMLVTPNEFHDLVARNQFDHISALPIFVLADIVLGRTLLAAD